MNEHMGKIIAAMFTAMLVMAGWTYSVNAEVAAFKEYIVSHERMHRLEHELSIRERQLEEANCLAFREAVRRDIERLFVAIEKLGKGKGDAG